jgi:DNA-binding NarL/FixJ family response regulator
MRGRVSLVESQTRTAVVVAREPTWLEAVERALAVADVRVVGRTASIVEAIRLLEDLDPEMLVCELPADEEAAPLAWLSEVRTQFRGKVIVLAASDAAERVSRAFAAGADAYVVKQRARQRDIAVAVSQVFRQSIYVNGPGLESFPARASAIHDGHSGLTKRQFEILQLIAAGLSNREIAGKLWITEQTVKFHLSNLYSKLGVTNRTAASRVAYMRGMLGGGNGGTNGNGQEATGIGRG